MAAWNSEEHYKSPRAKMFDLLDNVDTSALSDLGRIEYVKAAALLDIARKLK
ncbi:hypothetical protein HXX27_07665 [Weissella confusa]|uniref:hypothetical protein n=1 Tax=Weissella confusa TaxID=1583 RepID=UPI0018A29212|nr:hypothetical protein [Weissella confusa]MBF7056563.1 hypothetical protein [Weissella confusa]